jgi:hypothetical protein
MKFKRWSMESVEREYACFRRELGRELLGVRTYDLRDDDFFAIVQIPVMDCVAGSIPL